MQDYFLALFSLQSNINIHN